jgi:hypothetical protein
MLFVSFINERDDLLPEGVPGAVDRRMGEASDDALVRRHRTPIAAYPARQGMTVFNFGDRRGQAVAA